MSSDLICTKLNTETGSPDVKSWISPCECFTFNHILSVFSCLNMNPLFLVILVGCFTFTVFELLSVHVPIRVHPLFNQQDP